MWTDETKPELCGKAHQSKVPMVGVKHWGVLKWPAMGPDLNLTELLWRDSKTAVVRRHPSNLRDLEQFAKEEL